MQIDDFATEAAAQAWIDIESSTWIDKAKQSR
jgi:hypothetical protein